MKRYLTKIIVLLCGCISSAHAEDLERIYTATFAKTITFIDQNQDKVWPGFHINKTPTIMHFDDTSHLYAFNFIPKNPHWQKLIIEGKTIYYLDKDEYDLTGITYDWNVPIDDQESFIVAQPFDETKSEDIIFNTAAATHERFHGYQFFESKFPLEKLKQTAYDGFNQLMNVKLTYLEIETLKFYLLNTGDKAENALKDAIAIHQYRSQLLNNDSLTLENTEAVIEGSANYVGWKSMNLSDQDFVARITSPSFYGLEQCTLSDKTKYEEIDDCLSLHRYYFTGPAFGRSLDIKFTSSAWKREVETQGEAFETILQNFYHMTSEEIESRVHDAINNANYGFNKISDIIDHSLTPYLKEMAEKQEEYKIQSGIELQVDLVSSLAEESEQHDKSYEINSGLFLLTNANGSYKKADITEEIHYKNIPFLFDDKVDSKRDSRKLKKKILKAPSDTKLIIDGKEDTIGNFISTGKSAPFIHDVLIQNAQITIKVNGRQGTIDGRDAKLKLLIINTQLTNNQQVFIKKKPYL